MSHMIPQPLYVGIDYHQKQLQLCVLDAAAQVRVNRGISNDVQEVAATLRSLGQVTAVAIEACCGAADFGQALAGAGPWRVELAHPGYVARLKQSPDKTDYGDARLLADLTRVGYLPRVWLAPPEIAICANWSITAFGWSSVAGPRSCRSARCCGSTG